MGNVGKDVFAIVLGAFLVYWGITARTFYLRDGLKATNKPMKPWEGRLLFIFVGALFFLAGILFLIQGR